jgi:exopolysaccharide biosynthesis WecB/TagA/CpsF family protein
MQFNVEGGTVSVNVPTQAALLGEITNRLRHGRGFAVATLNLDHLAKMGARADFGDFHRIYQAQDLVTADGHPVVWMSRLAGQPVDLVTGSDLIAPLARLAAREHAPVGLFGSDEATLTIARARLMEATPGLDIALTIAPPMGFVPDGVAAEAALSAFKAAGVRVVLVALGAPKQETFAALGRRIAPEMGFVSIGAGLNFIAGTQRRAPVWVRRLAVEWLWRMLSDPRRLARRYVRCVAVLPRHLRDALALRGSHGVVSPARH